MINDRALIQISADSRALIRAAIKRNPGWREYANLHDCDLGSMTTRDAILDCCDALGIDVLAVTYSGPQSQCEPVRQPLPTAIPGSFTEVESPSWHMNHRPRLFGRPQMTEAEATRLREAREHFLQNGTMWSASELLEAAYDAWNESHMSEIDYVSEVGYVRRWLAREAGKDA